MGPGPGPAAHPGMTKAHRLGRRDAGRQPSRRTFLDPRLRGGNGMSDALSAAVSIGFQGLAFAMVLYLISVGLSVTMGLMGFVNLAHGVFAMVGGYVLTSLMSRLGVPFLPALLAAAVAVAAASLPIERLLYRRLYGGDELDQVLLTMGLVFMSVAAATYVWGPLQQPLQPPAWLSGAVDLGFRSFPAYRSFLILC